MIYQHATKDQDRTIADGLGQIARDARKTDRPNTALPGLKHSRKHTAHLGGAGDGNRTRMTSLEGFGYEGSELRFCRSAACPSVRE